MDEPKTPAPDPREDRPRREPEPVSGPDEEGEVPLGPDAIPTDKDGAWVHVDRERGG